MPTSVESAKDQVFFSEMHSFIKNITAELTKTRDAVAKSEATREQEFALLRRTVDQERLAQRDQLGRFRYDFDELVHKRVEAVRENLASIETSQKAKDRQQQIQLDTLESDLRSLRLNLSKVGQSWTRCRDHGDGRSSRQGIEEKLSSMTRRRSSLGEKCAMLKSQKEEHDMYEMAERLQKRLKMAAETLAGVEWELLVREMDSDNSGQIGFSEFLHLCQKKLRLHEEEEDLKYVFDSLDQDKSGEMSIDELIDFVADPAERMRSRLLAAEKDSKRDLGAMLLSVDTDGSGQINFAEFREFCHKTLNLLDADYHLKVVFKAVDVDHSGEVSIAELIAWCYEKKG